MHDARVRHPFQLTALPNRGPFSNSGIGLGFLLKTEILWTAPWSRACPWCPRVQWARVPMRTDRRLLPHTHAHALALPDPQPGPGRSGNVEVVTCCGLTIKVVVTPRGAASPLPTP